MTLKTWIVNWRTGSVNESAAGRDVFVQPDSGEFLFEAPTARDAALAGKHRRLAHEALAWAARYCRGVSLQDYTVNGDVIVPVTDEPKQARTEALHIAAALERGGWDVWREGELKVLVLGLRSER